MTSEMDTIFQFGKHVDFYIVLNRTIAASAASAAGAVRTRRQQSHNTQEIATGKNGETLYMGSVDLK